MEKEYPLAKLVRFQNGEDVIAELVELETDNELDKYLLINPLKVVYMGAQKPGYLQVAFLPWVFPRICDRQEFTIEPRDVMLISNVSQNMNDYYWESITHLHDETESSQIPQQEAEEDSEEFFDEDVKRTYH